MYRWCTLEVPPVPNPNSGVHVQSWIDVGFTKLRMWQLTQYSKLVYIDADCMVVQPVDELFDLPVDFAAAPDVFPPGRFILLAVFG
jgi:glycogenin glucosyltransferase